MSQIKSNVLKALEGAVMTENSVVIPAVDLGKDYLQLKELMARIGGKWKSSGKHPNGTPKGQFNFAFYDPRPIVAALLDSQTMPPKNPTAYFPTRDEEVEDMVYRLRNDYEGGGFLNNPERKILEPSAGGGAIARAIRKYVPEATLHVVEMLDINIARLKAQDFQVVHEGDFLAYEPTDRYDYIFMNPPFQGFNYIKHVTHAYSLLKPNGRLWAIVPDRRYLDNKKTQEFWEFVECQGSVENEYDESAFAHLGVKVQTVLIELDNRPEADVEYNGFKNRHVFNAAMSFEHNSRLKGFAGTFADELYKVYNATDKAKLEQLDYSDLRKELKPLIVKAKRAVWETQEQFLCLSNENFQALVDHYAGPDGSWIYNWMRSDQAEPFWYEFPNFYEKVVGEKPPNYERVLTEQSIEGMKASLEFLEKSDLELVETAIEGMEVSLEFL